MDPLAHAAQSLGNLGFLLLRPHPDRDGDAELVVALDDHPTLQHFDPETIRYWETQADRRGHPTELTRETAIPLSTTISWGKIVLVDRLGVVNEFVSLGGSLRAGELRPGRTTVLVSSPGPILRLGGHSQPVDADAPEVGAFFARLLAHVDFTPGAEAALSAAAPLERYAAYVAFEHDRLARAPNLRREQPRFATEVVDEALRLQRAAPEQWERGRRLLDHIGLH